MRRSNTYKTRPTANSTSILGVLLARAFLFVLGFTALVIPTETRGEALFVRGDPNGDRLVDITDIIQTLNFQFKGQPQFGCLDALDVDDNGVLDTTDPIRLLRHLLIGDPPPPPPLLTCGDDPSADNLDCAEFPACDGLSELPAILSTIPQTLSGQAGDVLTLHGSNLPPSLASYQISFRGAQTGMALPGVPLEVRFDFPELAPYAGHDTLPAEIDVIVPTGVESGSVELRVENTLVGALPFDASPAITSFSIGKLGDAEALAHNGVFGFDRQLGAETIQIHGLNLANVDTMLLEDGSGNQDTLTVKSAEFDPTTGLETIKISLENVIVSMRPPRDNLRVSVRTPVGQSNWISVPVIVNEQLVPFVPETLGASINGVTLPTGARTGPVRLRYFLYDRPLDTPYLMEFEWSVDGKETWFPALADMNDPVANGTDPLKPGVVRPSSLFFDHTGDSLPTGAGLRIFTWDAPNDENFRALHENAGGGPTRRHWSVFFRARATSATLALNRRDSGILFETPPIAYFDLEKGPGESVEDLRKGALVETFDDIRERDKDGTSAVWEGAGTLRGDENTGTPGSTFGDGNTHLVLEASASLPDKALDEFIEIDTTAMRISHVLIVAQEDPEAPLREEVTLLFPTVTQPNPGEDHNEFHLQSLSILDGVLVRAVGENPLVIRLAGPAREGDELVFTHSGILDANGEPGGEFDGPCESDLPPPPCPQGRGGQGGPGAGRGGTGAAIVQAIPFGYTINPTGGRGELAGGGLGETPGMLNPDFQAFSRFAGGAGGGGGGSAAGYAGSAPRSSPSIFPVVGTGQGGDERGDGGGILLSPGSGGGGGGATVVRSSADSFLLETPPFQGAGGGGGGGAVHIVARGDIVLSESARIQVNGGDGGRSDQRSGHGGAGSGGSILLQASGSATVPCDTLEYHGGVGGRGGQSNRNPGSGNGAPGRARVEVNGNSHVGCPDFATAESTLAEAVSDKKWNIHVTDTSRFTKSGVIEMNGERMAYERLDLTTLEGTRRGIDGTTPRAHEKGDVLRLINRQVNHFSLPRVSTGAFHINPSMSEALSLPRRLGVGPGSAVFTHALEIDKPEIDFAPGGSPPGTRTIVFWQHALEDLTRHAAPGKFQPGVELPANANVSDYYRFRTILQADASTGAAPEIEEIRLPYRMAE